MAIDRVRRVISPGRLGSRAVLKGLESPGQTYRDIVFRVNNLSVDGLLGPGVLPLPPG